MCISSAPPPADQQRAFPFLRSSDREPRPNTSSENSNTEGGAEPHKLTLVHKAAILNSLTGLYEEANKRETENVTPCTLCCASANSGASRPINSDRFLPDYTSKFPSPPKHDPGKLFGLGQNLQQRQKMAFFSTVRGQPILDHVILFCRLVHGAYRVSTVCAGPCSTLCAPTHTTHGPGQHFTFHSTFVSLIGVDKSGRMRQD